MPMNLTDLLNAKSLNKYYAGVKGTTLVEAMFPAVFSNTFDINTFGSLDGGAVEIDGVSEQIATRSGYLTRKMLPIPLKGLKDAFYSDAVAIGIFLEDMEREYKAYLEESRQPSPTKEKREKVKEEITLNNKTNDDKMDRKEEIDSFLEEVEETKPEKEPGKIRSFFRWFGELF